jgi:hypothetical protein
MVVGPSHLQHGTSAMAANGGLESALRAMEAIDVALEVFLETKLTGRIYT